MKDKIFGILQRVGRSFMLPIALLPVAGLLLGIGSSFTNPTALETYHLTNVITEGGFLYTALDIMSQTGSVVFDNLPLLFAIGVAIGMAKKEKEVAALSGAISYLIMNTVISALIAARGGAEAMAENSTASVLGITTLQMGVFGGIIVGLGVAALHNRFYKIQFPQILSFFGGTRFVPIISSLVYLIVGIIMFYIWPMVQTGISGLGRFVLQSGYAGTWLYGTIERALIPFGLHHVFYMPFWQTELGGSMVIDGVTVQGAQNIFFAQLASQSAERFSVEATRFMTGKFPVMMFGLPAAAYAMYRTAKPQKKKAVGGLLLSAALTSIITGITEPLEFTFLFAAPLMYAVHCVLSGLSFLLMHLFNVSVGMTFSGGAIDLFLFGVLQGNAKTNWILIPIIGIFYAVLYYFVFSIMITKLNLTTPGREADGQESKLFTGQDYRMRHAENKAFDHQSSLIVRGLGNADNISDLDCCATRLRVTVKHPESVNETLLKESGASGVIQKGTGIQIIYGPHVSVIKSKLDDFMEHNGSEPSIPSEQNRSVNEQQQSVKPISDEILYSPMNGTVVKLEEIPDDVFSGNMLGNGAGILPSEGKLYAPCNGTVTMIFETKHAINIISKNGAEILLHVGIDTVRLNGKHYTVHATDGQTVKAGDLLLSFDTEAIQKEGYSTITPIVICNSDRYKTVELLSLGKIKRGNHFLKLKQGD